MATLTTATLTTATLTTATTYHGCTYRGYHLPRRGQAWSERHEVPTTGRLRLRYRSTRPLEQCVVHYCLELRVPSQREVALQLYQHALVERGTHWQGERIDGIPFDVHEQHGGWQVCRALLGLHHTPAVPR